jgi:hypothetical protein
MAWGPGEVLGETIAQPDSLNTLRQRAMPRRLGCARKVRVNYGLPRGALNSAVECHLHTVEVAGSNPAAPTIESITYSLLLRTVCGLLWQILSRRFFLSSFHQHQVHRSDHRLYALRQCLHVLVSRWVRSRMPQVRLMSFTDPMFCAWVAI